MALSNSKVKSKDRLTLFYKKFAYRATLEIPELFWASYVSDFQGYNERIQARLEEEAENPRWYEGRKINVTKINYDLIEKYINFRNKYKNDSRVCLRHERNSAGIFTNDISIINELLSFYPAAIITHVTPMPEGVIYFKKDPPAVYRVYCRNVNREGSIRKDILDYLNRTPDVSPSDALKMALRREFKKTWFHTGQYFNYNDEKNLTMMHLMFPGVLGKSYKLEKKQD
jgi:hypothetical protein